MNNINPNHYTRLKPEVIQVINDYKLGFNLGNSIKYLARAEYKSNEKKDVEKAIRYLEFELKYNSQDYSDKIKIRYSLASKKEWSNLKYIQEIKIILKLVKTYWFNKTDASTIYGEVIKRLKEKIK